MPWAAAISPPRCSRPVLAWNAAHGWASFAKQGGRTGDWRPAARRSSWASLLAGQVGLATPSSRVLCAAGVWLAARQAAWRGRPGACWRCFPCPLAVFLQHALGDRVQANWPAIIYPGACIAAAALAGWWRRLCIPAIALGFAITLVVWFQAIAAPLPLPRALDPTLMRLGGWPELAADIAAEAWRDKARVRRRRQLRGCRHPRSPAATRPARAGRRGALGHASPCRTPQPASPVARDCCVRSARRADPPEPANWGAIAHRA